MKKNRAIIVSEYYIPHWTGIVVTFTQIAKNLISQGYRVTVLTTKYNDNLPDLEIVDGIKIIRSPYLVRLNRTHYSLKILLTFLRIITNFDTVVINSPNSNILFFTLIAKMFRKKVVIFHQGDLILPRQTGNQFVNRLMEKIFDVVTIPSMFLADRISCCTRDYAENSRVMHYFLHKFMAFVPNLTLPKTKLNKSSSNVVGFAGRFVEEKGYDILLKAIPILVKKNKKIRFVFAGVTNMDYEPFFQKHHLLIEKNKKYLTFLGLLSRDKLPHFYNMLDAFVISSRSDCFPTTQIEATLSGVPSVVTDIPGARMLVKETGFGKIVSTEDVNALANGIIDVLENKTYYQKKAKNVGNFIKKYDTFKID